MSEHGGLLLDTHVFLWWRGDPQRLGTSALTTIAEADLVFVSVVSAWEVAIKMSIGKLELRSSFEAGVEESDFSKLAMAFSHCELVATLPHHHRDPFDRMLIAQAQAEGLTLVTADIQLEAYKVPLMMV